MAVKTTARRAASPSSNRKQAVNNADGEEADYSSAQLQPLLQALQAARQGDFSSRLPSIKNGVLAEIYQEFNDVISLNENMAQEIVRLGKIVGREGKMTERATLRGASGSWAVSIDSINSLVEDLARPTTEVARVITAVANGDLTQKMALEIQGTPVKGEFLRIGTTVNTMVDQLSSFADEVTRVAREVGTEGKLGGQAKVKGVSGTWKDLTDNVNLLAGNLTNQVRNIALVTTAVANGDLSQKITVDVKGEILELKNTINVMVDQLNSFAAEVTRVAKEVGTEGKLGGQAEVKGVSGTWKDLTDNVNFMAGNLTTQVRGIAKVVTAVANGDLKQKLAVKAKGEVAALTDTINGMIDTLSIFADQVTTVAREVGTEGILGGQAKVPNTAGTWKELTDNVNFMAGNLTTQVRGIAKVVTAVANGDLKQKLRVEAKGEVATLAETINGMIDTLSIFADQVTTVAREVGTEGILGGQAHVPNVAGTWKDLTDNVNSMASNLTGQVRNIALVTTAVANGDLSQKITVDVKGEILELKNTINVMVDQLNSFAAEVTRVAKEVGTEGKLGGQAEVKGVSGTWKDLTDNVNILAGNLTNQVRNIALVTTAVANGDLSQKITVAASGEILELKDTINVMVDQLNSFAAEVTRVAREVGTEGKLGGQAEVKGVSGTWKDLTDNVNFMAGNLTGQVRDIALVTTAVANGDLSKKITVDVKGEILELKDTINVMVDQLRSFADEVTRVAKEVGTEGKLGGQAEVKGVSGTWKDLTDNVNILAGNLTNQVRNIALVTTAVANGDLSQKITVAASGEILELKDTINVMVDQLNSFAAEVTRVAREVGTEGKLGGQAEVKGVSGTWKDLTDNVNFMAGNLTTQVRGIVKVVTAVANGDLSQKLVVEAKGEVAALADTINGMIDTLSIFADQVTTVAREVGTEGILGGQAKVPNTAGTWKELTDNVNFMAGNLTTQVRGIAKIVTAVANGDLKQKLAVDAKGEVAALTDTINGMIDTLSIFADQVTTVAREVGTEGILGGQAKVPNAAGTWKELTDNVNFMANSLTVQVRAISDVATAVTEGDLTRSITVEAQGEVSELKNKINQMIGNLKDTTGQNQEQDWLKTNLARFSRMMQGQKTLESVARLIMSEVTPLVSAHHGVFYINDSSTPEAFLKLLSSYAYRERKHVSNTFELGEGLIGQCALERKTILLTNVPKDYIQINSGLGEATPLNIVTLPVLFEGDLMAVIELASFQPFSEIHMTFLEQLMESIGVVLNMIAANMRTEELLEQSQSLTQELQSQSQELQSRQEQLTHTNGELESQARELEEKAALLAEQNVAVEMKNREVELARGALEEKAQQLALSSKYKSEFLANMSHELRTPLNSMLILAKLMSDNQEGNLSGKQVEFASTIHGSGTDLLNLINEILDLSKVESGKMEVDVSDIALLDVRDQLMRSFEPIASQKGLDFSITLHPGTPPTMSTDFGRLQQVLKNLLSNALKFTEKGRVSLDIQLNESGGSRQNRIISFAVSDTGIGIAPSKQKLIFEAFQQADGTTSRRYGGTGLGLSISREIARLLGGNIQIESALGQGSTFTFFVPEFFEPGDYDTIDADGFSKRDGFDGDDSDGDDSDSDNFDNNGFSSAARSTPAPLPDGVNENASGPANNGAPPEVAVFDAATARNELNDDRDAIQSGDRVVLLIEDDKNFARILLDTARQNGFKALVATSGDVGLSMAQHYLPSAIALDLQLPVMDGWSVLDQLKRNPQTRPIPVQVISVADREHGAIVSAISYLQKPVSHEALEGAFRHIADFLGRDARRLLIVEDDEAQRSSMIELIGNRDVFTTAVGTGEEAIETLALNSFDCVILDLGLPGMEGFEVLKKIKQQPRFRDLPVVIYTSKDLSRREEAQLKKYAATILSKDIQSAEKLLDQTSLFLHRVMKKLPLSHPLENSPVSARPISAKPVSGKAPDASTPAAASAAHLKWRKVLVVDDDVRNVFALTSVLENYGLRVVYAENGNSCLAVLSENSDVSVILMDVMMPEMDGYETTRAIRALPGYATLPIIALTAKAMQGDREKCLEAGATDYIPKPVDTDLLLATMSRWIAQRTQEESSAAEAESDLKVDSEAEVDSSAKTTGKSSGASAKKSSARSTAASRKTNGDKTS